MIGAVALAALYAKLALDLDNKAAHEIYIDCLARIPSGERSMRFRSTTLKYHAFGIRHIFLDFTWITVVGYVASFEIFWRIRKRRTVFDMENLVSNIFCQMSGFRWIIPGNSFPLFSM